MFITQKKVGVEINFFFHPRKKGTISLNINDPSAIYNVESIKPITRMSIVALYRQLMKVMLTSLIHLVAEFVIFYCIQLYFFAVYE